MSFLSIISLSSCRMNNGDIGEYFGSWLVCSMTVDGTEAEDFDPETTFWEFQNNIIRISLTDSHYDIISRWGTWHEEDNRLILDFTHHDDANPEGTSGYKGPEWLLFPSSGIIDLTFVERGHDRMKLSWQDPEGHTIVYSLRKIW